MADTRDVAGLHLGQLMDIPSVPLVLEGSGLTAHTLIVGQSGSGKSFMLGRLLEEIAVATEGRLLILDPNSDFLRLSEPDVDAWRRHKDSFAEYDTENTFTESWNKVPVGVLTKRTGLTLRATVSDFVIPWDSSGSEFDLARRLGFDPRVDIEEVFAISRALKANGEAGQRATTLSAFDDVVEEQWRKNTRNDATERADGRLYLRTRENHHLDVWGAAKAPDSIPAMASALFGASPKHRVMTLDIASLPSADARLMVTQSALQALWDKGREAWAKALEVDQKDDPRRPVFVVIDEAHNLAAADSPAGLQGIVLETLRRIATEGRKYAIYLILVTQRPTRLDSTIRSQCDNLCLLKMNDRHDLALIEQSFGFVPMGWCQRALEFRKGDMLLAGGLAERPVYARVAPRRTIEGGRSPVSATWLPHVAARKTAAEPRPTP